MALLHLVHEFRRPFFQKGVTEEVYPGTIFHSQADIYAALQCDISGQDPKEVISVVAGPCVFLTIFFFVRNLIGQ